MTMLTDGLEVQGVATERKDVFPYSGLRVLGFIHLINGMFMILLGIIDLAITIIDYEEDLRKYGSDYEIIVSLTVASVPLWCGMWFALTGSLGTCFTRARAHTLQFFKITFLVLNITCAALFGTVSAVVCALIAVERHTLDPTSLQWLVALVLCFMGLLEVFIATATSSVLCCCSPVRGTQVHILVSPESNNNPKPKPMASERFPKQPEKRQSNSLNDSTNGRQSHVSHMTKETTLQPRAVTAETNNEYADILGSGRNRQPRRRPDDEHMYDGFGDSNSYAGSYSKLKKFALPGW